MDWIPVSERLPEEYVAVLVSRKQNYSLPRWTKPQAFEMVTIASWDGIEEGWSLSGVHAWMPLPKPYQKKRKKEETNLVESEMEEFNLDDFTECSFDTTQIKLIERMIASLPTIEIVLCKDCKHYDKRTTHTGLCGWHKASGYILGVGFNDYCSMANQDPITESEV